MPRQSDSTLARVFGRSPFSALFQHIAAVDEGAGMLAAFLAAARQQDWVEAERQYQAIRDCEHQADDLKNDIRLHLPRRLFLPISRADLLALIEAQDKIINKIKDISGLMLGRKMQFPAIVEDEIVAYTNTAIEAVHQSRALLAEFDDLLAAGFTADTSELIETAVSELGRLENRADQQEMALRHALLAVEAELSPLEAMFLYRVIDWIGALADRAERVGTRLQILTSH